MEYSSYFRDSMNMSLAYGPSLSYLKIVLSTVALNLFRGQGLTPVQLATHVAEWALLMGQVCGTVRPAGDFVLSSCYEYCRRQALKTSVVSPLWTCVTVFFPSSSTRRRRPFHRETQHYDRTGTRPYSDYNGHRQYNLLVRLGLQAVIKACTHIQLIGEATSLAEAEGIIAREHPHLLMVEGEGKGEINMLELVWKLKASVPTMKIILFSGIENTHGTWQALSFGIDGIVLTIQPPTALLATIDYVCHRPAKAVFDHAIEQVHSTDRAAPSPLQAPPCRKALTT